MVIEKLIAAISGDVYRPNLYAVQILLPASGPLSFLNYLQDIITCSATSLPADEIHTVGVPFNGREVKFPTNRTFPQWTATMFDSYDLRYYKQFKIWQSYINNFQSNTASKKFSL